LLYQLSYAGLISLPPCVGAALLAFRAFLTRVSVADYLGHVADLRSKTLSSPYFSTIAPAP